MKRLFFLSSVTVSVFIWLIYENPMGYDKIYLSFYSITAVFVFYFMFNELQKQIKIVPTDESRRSVYNSTSELIKFKKTTYPYLIYFVILCIGTISVFIRSEVSLSQIIPSLFLTTSIIFLAFLFVFLLNFSNSIPLNNLPALFNALILPPLFFQDQFSIFKTIFDFSVLNTLINTNNRPYSILYSLLLISLFIVLIKYISKRREVVYL